MAEQESYRVAPGNLKLANRYKACLVGKVEQVVAGRRMLPCQVYLLSRSSSSRNTHESPDDTERES